MEELLVTLIGIVKVYFIFMIIFSLFSMLLYSRFDDKICDIKKTLIEIEKLLKEHFEKENKQDK